MMLASHSNMHVPSAVHLVGDLYSLDYPCYRMSLTKETCRRLPLNKQHLTPGALCVQPPLAGMFVGLMSDRGRGSMGSYVGNVVYTIVAMGMLATVSNADSLCN